MITRKYLFPFILVTSLFFLWGFVHNLDPILIPHLKSSFSLNTLQSSLVDFAVFIAYFIMALPAGMIMRRYGYKSGIIIGLLLFALGSFLFVPAANTQQYGFFLGALFIIACGLTILETAANPYVTILGPQESSTQRLNFAQSFNGLAVTIAPIIGGLFILSPLNEEELKTKLASLSESAKIAYLQSEAESVKMPYIVLGSIILVVAILFIFTKLPDIKEEASEKKNILHAFRHRNLTWAVIAQFFYVGAQVCVQSFFILFATDVAGLTRTDASWYLGLGYGIAFVSGRFIGTFLMRYIDPAKLLSIFAAASILLSLIAINATGMTALYALIGTSFFMSIMFPTIFALGIKGLGADTKIGSSLIIMAIVGGALLPLALGYIADQTRHIQYGYYVPMICFVVVLYFGMSGYKPGKIMNRRYCLTLDLKNDPELIRQYEEHHKAVWPEIIKSIKDSGIENMEIYRLENRLFMIIEANDAFSFEKKQETDKKNPKVEEWENLMWNYQQAISKDGKWVLMNKIFELKEF